MTRYIQSYNFNENRRACSWAAAPASLSCRNGLWRAKHALLCSAMRQIFAARSGHRAMASMQREFPNSRLDFLHAHPSLGIIAAQGSRTCMVLSPTLDIIQRHLDTNRNEKFYCCEFADVLDAGLPTSPDGHRPPACPQADAARQAKGAPAQNGPAPNSIPFTDDNDLFFLNGVRMPGAPGCH